MGKQIELFDVYYAQTCPARSSTALSPLFTKCNLLHFLYEGVSIQSPKSAL